MLGAIAVLATGCAGSGEQAVSESASQPAMPTATTSPPTTAEQSTTQADTAPTRGLMVNTIDGGQLDFSALIGQDLVLWFWAPW